MNTHIGEDVRGSILISYHFLYHFELVPWTMRVFFGVSVSPSISSHRNQSSHIRLFVFTLYLRIVFCPSAPTLTAMSSKSWLYGALRFFFHSLCIPLKFLLEFSPSDSAFCLLSVGMAWSSIFCILFGPLRVLLRE